MNRSQRRASRFKRAQRTQATYLEADPAAALLPLRILTLARPYDAHETVDDHIKTRAAHERLVHGTGMQDDFDRVAIAINLAKVRALDIDESLADMLERAQDAMAACKARYLRCGRFGFDGPGLQIMAEALDAHEAITDASSPLQMHQAQQVVAAALGRADGVEVSA